MRRFLWFAFGFVVGVIFATVVAYFLLDFDDDHDLEFTMRRTSLLIVALLFPKEFSELVA
jgi:hypothetical protein